MAHAYPLEPAPIYSQMLRGLCETQEKFPRMVLYLVLLGVYISSRGCGVPVM